MVLYAYAEMKYISVPVFLLFFSFCVSVLQLLVMETRLTDPLKTVLFLIPLLCTGMITSLGPQFIPNVRTELMTGPHNNRLISLLEAGLKRKNKTREKNVSYFKGCAPAATV